MNREGAPWMPEEDLLVLAEEPAPPRAFEAYDAIAWLRSAAIGVVAAHDAGVPIGDAVAELEEALLAGVEVDE